MMTAAERPDQVALRSPDDAVLADLRAARCAGSPPPRRILHDLGLRKGDALGLMMLNRPEFHVVDAAAMLLGATPFSLYNTSPAEQIAFVMGDAGNRLVVAEPRFADVVREAAGDGVRVVELDELDGGDEDFDLERALARGGARGPADADLHLRHHGAAEGRRADPRQHAGRAARRPRRGAAGERRALGLLPALGPRRRPLGLALLGAHDLRPHGDAGGRPDAGDRRRRPGPADGLRRRPARVGEAQGGARGLGRRGAGARAAARAPRASTRRAGWPSARRRRRSRCSSSSPRAACPSARCGA